jgi:hypothetical protein
MARSTKSPPLPAPPRAEPDPLLRQRGWAALVLGLLSVVGLFFLGNLNRGLYVVALSLVFGVVAIWLGTTSSRRARRGGMARPRGAVSGIVFGGLGLVLGGAVLVVFLVFSSQLRAYNACMASANTLSAQQACQNQLSNSINAQLSRLESGH